MERNPSLFPLVLKYALIIGLIAFIWGLIAYMTGWYLQNWVNYVSYAILIAGVILVIRNRRNQQLNGYITMNQALSTGCLFSVLYGILGVAGFLLTVKFIAPDMTEQILQATEEQMIRRGLSDSEVETAMEWTRKFMQPLWLSVTIIGFTLLFGGIVSFLAALFLKRNPPEF
ncbi:MAG: DUF4199 domain-containing protein [Chitinophagales bacterium]|nr:DUF4199 domain-containing protein [Chitinophagales bacterium]MDW8394257.1 DUF4199 domain-containing protein [Chitinophagales bacterium]